MVHTHPKRRTITPFYAGASKHLSTRAHFPPNIAHWRSVLMARLTASFWVSAYITRLRLADIAAFVVAHGDDTAGAVLVKQATLDGQATLHHRSFDLTTGDRTWAVLAQGTERDVDAAIARQKSFDPDLWVIEVEDRAGRHLLDEDGLS